MASLNIAITKTQRPDWIAVVQASRLFGLGLVACVVIRPAMADDGPAEEIPELKVLSQYAGDWDLAYTSKDAPFKRGEYHAKWTLNGRFLQRTGKLEAVFTRPKTLRLQTFLTYDPIAGAYRSSTFLSNGRTLESSGTWDPETRTMTWVSTNRDNKILTTTTETFADDGSYRWTNVSIKEGRDIGRSTGKATRSSQASSAE